MQSYRAMNAMRERPGDGRSDERNTQENEVQEKHNQDVETEYASTVHPFCVRFARHNSLHQFGMISNNGDRHRVTMTS